MPIDLDALRTAVVKITCYTRPFDWQQPFNKNLSAAPGTGTGFVLKEVQSTKADTTYVVTAYHVVSFGQRLLVEFSDAHYLGGPVEATLVAYSVSLDAAVISVPVAMPSWLQPLKMATSDALKPSDQVQAAGFPLRKGFQMTAGYVSGRSSNPERVQIDAAINPGNSGGPLVLMDEGQVIGIVVSAYKPDAAQNMNYASPIEEVNRALFALLLAATDTFPITAPQLALNIDVVRTDPALRATYKGDTDTEGAYISYVHPRSQFHAMGARAGDLLYRVDNVPVDIRGNVRVTWWPFEALPVGALLARMTEGQELDVAVLSRKRGIVQQKVLRTERELAVFRDLDAEAEAVPFCIKGGLVVQPLSVNLMGASDQIRQRLWYVFNRPELRADSLLVVSYVLPESPFTTMGTIHAGDVIVRVNDRRVGTLAEYERAFESAGSSTVVVLHTYFGDIACATTESLDAIEEQLRKRLAVVTLA